MRQRNLGRRLLRPEKRRRRRRRMRRNTSPILPPHPSMDLYWIHHSMASETFITVNWRQKQGAWVHVGFPGSQQHSTKPLSPHFSPSHEFCYTYVLCVLLFTCFPQIDLFVLNLNTFTLLFKVMCEITGLLHEGIFFFPAID